MDMGSSHPCSKLMELRRDQHNGHNQCWRHRLDPRRHCPGHDDDARAGILLRWHGSEEESSLDYQSKLYHYRFDQPAMVHYWLYPVIRHARGRPDRWLELLGVKQCS